MLQNEKGLKKEVQETMGGKVLTLPSEIAERKGRREGKKEGIIEGKKKASKSEK